MAARKKLLIVNGPGLADIDDVNQEDFRNPSLDAIRRECRDLCESLDIDVDFRQSDDQGALFEWIGKDSEKFDAIIINPVAEAGAVTLDLEGYRSAIKKLAHFKRPVIEVHLANIYSRKTEISNPLHEPDGDMGLICGLGKHGYLMAIKALAHRFSRPRPA